MKEERSSHRKKNNICSKTEGALFLAMSFFALLSIGVLGYIKVSELDKSSVSILPTSNITKPESKIVLTPIQQKIQDKLPVVRGDMVVPDIGALQGSWVSLFQHGGVVNLSLFGESYEIVHMKDIKSSIREYSKGRYSYDANSGKITLSPVKEMGAPDPVKGVSYKVLTMRKYDIFVSKVSDDVSLYFIAPEELIPQKNYHPLFSYADYDGAPVLQFSPTKFRP
ncbi:MAG: hypothetical protein ACRBB3_08615 [Alphaproteobacteria bacterium]